MKINYLYCFLFRFLANLGVQCPTLKLGVCISRTPLAAKHPKITPVSTVKVDCFPKTEGYLHLIARIVICMCMLPFWAGPWDMNYYAKYFNYHVTQHTKAIQEQRT